MAPEIKVQLGRAYPDGVVVLGETCEQCGERVRYWNDRSGGNAACGCTAEGPEACDWITARRGDELAPAPAAMEG